jgi:hypothetical protein
MVLMHELVRLISLRPPLPSRDNDPRPDQAHIRHMNHSRLFHKLNQQLCDEVKELQRRNYFGDGKATRRRAWLWISISFKAC